MGDQALQALGASAQDDARPFHRTRGLADGRCERLWVVDLAVLLGVNERTVRRMYQRGDLPRPLAVSGPLCWTRRSIAAWLERE